MLHSFTNACLIRAFVSECNIQNEINEVNEK